MKLAKVKELFKTTVYKIDYFILKCFGKSIIMSKGIRKVHFGVDDVF